MGRTSAAYLAGSDRLTRLGGEPGLGQVERDVPLPPVQEADREIPDARHPKHEHHQHGAGF
jgi:hypothetical protein